MEQRGVERAVTSGEPDAVATGRAPADRVVASTADVLRTLGAHPDRLPSNLVLVTGPSRTGYIEQILTIGVHGPVAVHVVVTG